MGSALFKWFNSVNEQASSQIQEWDSQGMTGFSDGYSYISDSNPTSSSFEKGFAFINSNTNSGSIETPDEKSYTGAGGKSKGDESDEAKAKYEHYISQRNNEVPLAPPRIQ